MIKMRIQYGLPAALPVLLLLFGACQTAPPITFGTLLDEIVERDERALYPEPYYTTRQFSSYDRASVAPGDPSWFANWDRSMFIREEERDGRREYVMMDVEGPGAVVRFWMTFAGEKAGEGILRIYFDREETPSVEGTALDILSGGMLTGEPLSSSVSPETDYKMRGHNLYLPLPFAANCKITYESEFIRDAGAKTGGEAVYYNINYREYGKNAKVQTFTLDDLQKHRTRLDEIQNKLALRDKDADIRDRIDTVTPFEGAIAPGESLSLSVEGSRAIRRIGLKLASKNLEQALRSTILKISFDGRETVWCPVGDFFGTGYQIRPSDTWYTTVGKDGAMAAYWVMPFKTRAEITLLNLDDVPVEIMDGEIHAGGWRWDKQSMHFGASWLQYTDIYTGERKTNEGGGNPYDINYTHLEGAGVYIGDVLTLFNTTYAWWGEGDEKIYIDGEDFPSHFGTGTEDYYGYAWCRPEVFTNHPFISQPDGSGNFWPGYTVNMRFRGLDDIPFRTELRVDMEMWHWGTTRINFAPAAFFYLKPEARCTLEKDETGARQPVALERRHIISDRIESGLMEGENMVLESESGGRISYQYGEDWSGGLQLWWRDGKPGDVLVKTFEAPEAGTFDVTARLTRAPDYGRVSMTLNGRPFIPVFDGLDQAGVSTTDVRAGRHALLAGENVLRITITGKSPVEDRAFFGLDYLKFE
jgi:hypothetical protein